MKSALTTFLLLLLFTTSAHAVVEPDADQINFFFDLNGDVMEYWSAPYVVVPAYVLATNPSYDALYGYEFGFDVEGNATVTGVTLNGAGPIDVGGEVGNHIVGLAEPLPTSEATLVCTLQIFLMDIEGVVLALTGAEPNSVPGSTMPAVLLANDEIIPLEVRDPWYSCGLPAGWAIINVNCPTANEERSWDSVKSLYR